MYVHKNLFLTSVILNSNKYAEIPLEVPLYLLRSEKHFYAARERARRTVKNETDGGCFRTQSIVRAHSQLTSSPRALHLSKVRNN